MGDSLSDNENLENVGSGACTNTSVTIGSKKRKRNDVDDDKRVR